MTDAVIPRGPHQSSKSTAIRAALIRDPLLHPQHLAAKFDVSRPLVSRIKSHLTRQGLIKADGVMVVVRSRSVIAALDDQATRRGTTVDKLVKSILDRIAQDDLFDAVLGDE